MCNGSMPTPFAAPAVLGCSWAMALEAALGFQLDAFIVHSLADSKLLRQMINRCFAGGRVLQPAPGVRLVWVCAVPAGLH